MDISDYIEYEYWNYIRDAIFVFEGNVEAFSALQDTVAFIDGDSFAIVSNNPMSINTIKKYEQLIISTLKSYNDYLVQHDNPGNTRFCETCGKTTLFFKEGFLKDWKQVQSECIPKQNNNDTNFDIPEEDPDMPF